MKKLLILSVLVFSFTGVLFFGDINQVIKKSPDIDPIIFLIVPIIVILNYIIRGYRFHLFLKQTNTSIGIKKDIILFLSGMSFTITPGKVGEIFKSYFLKKKYKTPYTKSLPCIVGERIYDLIALGFLSLLVIFRGQNVLWVVMFLFIFSLMITLGLSNTFFMFVSEKILKKIGKDINYNSEEFHKNMKKIFKKKILSQALLLSVLAWMFEGLSLWIIVESFGINTSALVMIFAFSISTLAGAISMIPGGLLASEASLLLLLVAENIPKDVSSLSVVLVRFFTLIFAVIIGIIFLNIFLKDKNKKLNDVKSLY